MKGIIMAGGKGTRLYPATGAVSKQLLPVYDKPLIYYPLSVLMMADIKDILIVTTSDDQAAFKKLLGDGSTLGINLEYVVQQEALGIAQAFILGEKFIGNSSVCLILGDNIFYGQGFTQFLREAASISRGARVFAYNVNDPTQFGVVEFDDNSKVKSIEEKPRIPKSNSAITGLYFYDNDVVDIAKKVKKSTRGEFEITSVNDVYLTENKLDVTILGRGFTWLDTGTPDGLLEASQFVALTQKKNGYYVACVEEIALNKGWVSPLDIKNRASKLMSSSYAKYLMSLV